MKMFYAQREGIANIFILEYDPWHINKYGNNGQTEKNNKCAILFFG